MKKIIFCFILSLLSFNSVFAQMSDEQIMNYVKDQYTKGLTQQEIATNLVKKGVTKEQLERIKKREERKQASEQKDKENSKQTSNTNPRTRKQQLDEDQKDQTETTLETNDFSDLSTYLDSTIIANQKKDSIQVFGRSIFQNKNLSFGPDVNIPTPVDYRLGPGDEVIIDIWGASEASIREEISPEGSIMVERLGPVYLNGMTIREANNYIQKKFSNIYSGIEHGGTSQIRLTLGQIRTIQVNVMGEVLVPGTYSLSSLSSVFHALYRAGGVNDIGSLRSVRLYRNGKLLRTLDIYKYILEGKIDANINLTDGDVIIVDPYISLVKIGGAIKRPMYYEMKKSETVGNLIDYAGGFTGDSYTDKIKLVRKTGGENKIFTIPESDYKNFVLRDKDTLYVDFGLETFDNRVEIIGAVFRSGHYEISKNINTVKELIQAADGLRGDAFLNRAVLTREKDDFTTEAIPINLRMLLYENGDDVVLRKNDILYIPSINDLRELGDITVFGEVAKPGDYKYSDNLTVEDLIVQAGGLLESASTARVDVSRRIIDPTSTEVKGNLSETFTFQIKDGLIVEGDNNFALKPYDQVYVRKSPGYRAQQNVEIEGEVLFPGMYALSKKTERISDLIQRAGSLTPDSYPEGARLVRKRTEEELFRSQTALNVASQGGRDSISVKNLDMDEFYNVGIELNKALLNPKSDFDVVLREGDKLVIPEYDNTVKINGAVMYPNTIVFKKGEKLSYYVNQAGGYADNAKKNKSFVIYMNGTVSKVKGSDRSAIKPGSEIIVPSKEQARKLSVSEILSLGTSVTSMASLISVLINTVK